MTIPTTDQIKKAYAKAPGNVRAYMNSEEYSTAFGVLREEYKLHLDEMGSVANALEAVFLELVPANQFPELLKEALEQNQEQYPAILSAINQNIFDPFRTLLTASPKPKEVPESVPAIVATPAVDTTQPHRTADLLEKKVNISPETVEVDAFKDSEEIVRAPQQPTYQEGVDPYREPID